MVIQRVAGSELCGGGRMTRFRTGAVPINSARPHFWVAAGGVCSTSHRLERGPRTADFRLAISKRVRCAKDELCESDLGLGRCFRSATTLTESSFPPPPPGGCQPFCARERLRNGNAVPVETPSLRSD